MTPIFSRSWLMKITEVRERLMAPASLRSAWLINRACSPGSESPMSPSISAFGTRAATESTPIRMSAPLPQVFSICVMARLRAFLRSSESCGTSLSSAAMSVLDMGWEPRLVRPEYTPKPRLSPPGAERVGQVLQLAIHDRDAVKPIDVRRLPEAVHPDPRRLHELTPLRSRHRLERAPEGHAPPSLHLHEGHQVALPRDQVDLRMPYPKPMRDDRASP